jgi:hypothetical protein
MYKKRAPRRLLRCTFECPAKGRVDINVWPRVGETDQDACWRALRNSKIDAYQVPYCKLTEIKALD